ncbi:MAG: hypothetical protein Q8N63_08930 [Nanoarchaeota archaeon]|nr:hypothetical protein [Nanoarchaeota archaeon]
MKKRTNSRSDFIINKNILLKSKRSQSGIITTILIILIIFVAITIVWNLVKSTIETNTQNILIDQFAIDLEVTSVYISGDDQAAYVSIRRGAGGGEISALNFLFTGSSYIYRYPLESGIPSELGSKVYNITVDAIKAQNPSFINFSSIKSVGVAFEIAGSGNGKTITTPIKSEFKGDLRSNTELPNQPNIVPPYIEAGECTDGDKRQCGITETGPCQFGNETCSGGIWQGICIGSINPVTETCNNIDDDCNGAIDEGVTRQCGNDTGECQSGNEACSGGIWQGICVGSIGPVTESLASGNCVDGLNNDCDGFTDTDPECSSSCGGNDTSCGTTSCTNCNSLDGCNLTSYRNYFCSGTSCSYTSDLCTDCSCACGGYNVTESIANGNCVDGKNNDCDGFTDTDPECTAGTNYTARSCNVHGSASSTGVKCLAGSYYRREDFTNATFGTCADGSSNSSLMYIENIFVNATTVLITDTVQVKCHVRCNSNATEYAILYNNGSSWINKQYANCIGSGFENKTIDIPIDNIAGTHYFRCWESSSGCTATNLCCSSLYGDNDDMKITVI